MSFYMQAGNQPTKIRCDCAERFGVTINSYKQFEELKAFFEGQAEKGIFRDIPVQQPYYIGKGASHEIKWYAVFAGHYGNSNIPISQQQVQCENL